MTMIILMEILWRGCALCVLKIENKICILVWNWSEGIAKDDDFALSTWKKEVDICSVGKGCRASGMWGEGLGLVFESWGVWDAQ